MPRDLYLAALAGQRFRMPADGEGGDLPAGDGADGSADSSDSSQNSSDGSDADDNSSDDSQKGGDDQNSDDSKSGEGGDDDSDEESEGAPEQYEDFSLPEGFELTEERSELLGEFAKSNNWSQEQAQEAVDLYAKLQQEDVQAQSEAWSKRQESWLDEIKADESISKNMDATNEAIGKALDKFGSDELRDLMDPYHPTDNPNGLGIGNNPELVRFFAKVGQQVGEDSFEDPDRGGSGKKPLHERMWDK